MNQRSEAHTHTETHTHTDTYSHTQTQTVTHTRTHTQILGLALLARLLRLRVCENTKILTTYMYVYANILKRREVCGGSSLLYILYIFLFRYFYVYLCKVRCH